MIKVFYDSKCGVCRREMDHYRRIAPIGVFDWVDIIRNPQSLPAGTVLAEALKELHVLDHRGDIHKGVDAFLVIWTHLPRYAWLAAVIRFPGVHFLAVRGYTVFAAVRFRIMGYDRCSVKKVS